MEFIKKNIDIFIVFFVSVAIYILIFGISSIDINNYRITLRGATSEAYKYSFISSGIDICEHYLGSIFYRLEDFGSKIFVYNGIGYPYEISVLSTDSIPIFALIFKIFTKIFKLTPHAQYFGIWTLACMILQGIFSVLIFRELKFDKISATIASFFLILSPIMIVRTFEHSALAAHFLILMGIYLYIKDTSKIKRYMFWVTNFLLVLLIQPNFLPMCFGIYCADFAKRIFITHEIKISKFILFNIFLFLFFAIFIFSTGLIPPNSVPMKGYNFYSANLNSFFNPIMQIKISSIFPAFSYGSEGQFEGCAYLGFGIIILLILALYKAGEIKDKYSFKDNWPIYAAILGLTLFALSNKIYFGDKLILNYPLPHFVNALFGNFRTSGRIIWPVWYIIYLSAVYILFNVFTKKRFITVLFIAIIIQIIDLYPLFIIKHNFISNINNTEFVTLLTNNDWNNGNYAKKYDGLTILQSYNSPQNVEMIAFFSYFWVWALKNNKNINTGYLSRMPKDILENMQNDLEQVTNDVVPNNKRLYVLLPSAYEYLKNASKTNLKSLNMLKRLRHEIFGIYILAP